MILVVCALAAELRGWQAPEGVELLAAGIGPVEAAAATARALASGRFTIAINAGIAGAFRERARIGDATLVTHECLADLGLEGSGALTLPDGAALVHEVEADATLLDRLDASPIARVRGVTVSLVTTTEATAERLQRAYAADVESMEGFAVLRAAQLAGVAALEIRGISNYVGDRAHAQWDFRAGSQAAVGALAALLPCLT